MPLVSHGITVSRFNHKSNLPYIRLVMCVHAITTHQIFQVAGKPEADYCWTELSAVQRSRSCSGYTKSCLESNSVTQGWGNEFLLELELRQQFFSLMETRRWYKALPHLESMVSIIAALRIFETSQREYDLAFHRFLLVAVKTHYLYCTFILEGRRWSKRKVYRQKTTLNSILCC